MIKDTQLEIIQKYNTKLCILVGDKNQLNPVNCDELNIFENNKINLNQNMRCSNNQINQIYDYLLQQISNYTPKFDFKIFVKKLYEIIFDFRDNHNIYVVQTLNDFIDLYSHLYNQNETIIGNYTNKMCCKLNTRIKNSIISNNNIDLIDKFYIGQQIIFTKPYEDWHISDFAKIKSIEETTYNFTKITYNHIIQHNKSYKTNIIIPSNINNIYTHYTNLNTKLGKSQQLFNYIIHITNTSNEIKKIFDLINNYPKFKVQKIQLDNLAYIYVLHSKTSNDYNVYIDSIKNLIKNLLNTKIKKTYKKLFNEYIIEALWFILNKFRIDIFAQIDDGFACTIHKLQGSSIENMFVNLPDLFNLTDNNKNKLKCIYTAFSRAVSKLGILVSFNPICKCNLFCSEKYDDVNMEYYWICKNKKCNFYESKSAENNNCKQCLSCSKIFYNTYITDSNLCFYCSKQI